MQRNMMQLVLGIATSLAVVATLCAVTASAPTAADHQSSKPIVGWTGSYTSNPSAEILRITDSEQWKECWQKHVGEHPEKDSYGWTVMPEIDFEKYMVLAIFEGDRRQTRKISIEGIDETTEGVRVRFMNWTYGIAVLGEPDDEQLQRLATKPYGLFVLPHTDKPLIVERQRGGKSVPITWEEAARFEGRLD